MSRACSYGIYQEHVLKGCDGWAWGGAGWWCGAGEGGRAYLQEIVEDVHGHFHRLLDHPSAAVTATGQSLTGQSSLQSRVRSEGIGIKSGLNKSTK